MDVNFTKWDVIAINTHLLWPRDGSIQFRVCLFIATQKPHINNVNLRVFEDDESHSTVKIGFWLRKSASNHPTLTFSREKQTIGTHAF